MEYQLSTNAFFPWFPKKILMTIILLSGLVSSHVMAGGVPMQLPEKIKYVFDHLSADNIKILDEFYAPDTVFIDPIGEHKGIQSVRDYYKNLYQNVKSIKFDYSELVSSENSHSLYWTMTLVTDGLNGGEPVVVKGNSHIKFNKENLVTYHRDYFDMGEFIYEDLPVMGWAIRKIKGKLRGDK